MADNAKAGLLRALGRVVRGLSILFWGLGLTALVYFRMVEAESADLAPWEMFSRFGAGAVPALNALLWFGLQQMRSFQAQERIWQRAVNRAQVLALVCGGLAPFLYWWHQFPAVPLFADCAGLLVVSSLGLLMQINWVLQRLAAMLPDESLRAETKFITQLNFGLLLGVLAGLAAYGILSMVTYPPDVLQRWLETARAGGIWLALFLILLPLAMTLALIWKIKELIFGSLLSAEN